MNNAVNYDELRMADPLMNFGVHRLNELALQMYKDEFARSLSKPVNIEGNFLNVVDPLNSALDEVFLVQHLKHFDAEWHRNSINYVNSLSLKDKFILRTYTRNGDELMNALIRDANGFDTNQRCLELIDRCIMKNLNNVIAVQLFEINGVDANAHLIYDENDVADAIKINNAGKALLIQWVAELSIQDVKLHLQKLISDIRRIINDSPRLNKIIKLYRGIKHDYAWSAENDNQVVLSGFQSTSYSISKALAFSGQYNENNIENHYMMYCIVLHPGIPCIAMESISHFSEKEILIDMNVVCEYNMMFYEKLELTPREFTYNALTTKPILKPKTSIYVKYLTIVPIVENANNNGNNNVNFSSNNALAALSGINSQSGGKTLLANPEQNIIRVKINNQYNRSRKNKRIIVQNRKQQNIQTAKQNRRNVVNKNNNSSYNRKELQYIKNNQYEKVRDNELGFVIVKSAEIPAGSKRMLAKMRKLLGARNSKN
jgi:hypothetical protein